MRRINKRRCVKTSARKLSAALLYTEELVNITFKSLSTCYYSWSAQHLGSLERKSKSKRGDNVIAKLCSQQAHRQVARGHH